MPLRHKAVTVQKIFYSFSGKFAVELQSFLVFAKFHRSGCIDLNLIAYKEDQNDILCGHTVTHKSVPMFETITFNL